MTSLHHVEIIVTGDCGHVLGTWTDEIAEKYPFYCQECGETPSGKYPWKLATRVIACDAEALKAEEARAIRRTGFAEGLAACGDVTCRHARDSHWEHAEPDGPRQGCAILGCQCMAYMA